jgi:GT2 family glycosyltransferase
MITAVVLNYNSSTDVESCIRFLQRQVDVSLEIVVVDNASAPEDLSRLRQICNTAGVHLLESAVNRGYSGGNNLGLEHAVSRGSEWALVINPDVELRDSSYLRSLVDLAAEHSDAVVVGSDVVLPDGTHQNPMRELSLLEEILWPVDVISGWVGREKDYLAHRTTGYCNKLSGCCLLIRCSFLEAHGYLDDKVFLYCEEPILAMHVKSKGLRLLYDNRVVAHHVHQASKAPAHAMETMLHSRCYYLKRYSGYSGVALSLAIASRRLQQVLWRLISLLDLGGTTPGGRPSSPASPMPGDAPHDS